MRRVSVCLPGSKSIAARALLLSDILRLDLRWENLPDCDDTRELGSALGQLHECYLREEGRTLKRETYHLGEGGTSLRFFLAYVASLEGFEGVVDCGDSLRRRPLAPLIESLREAGAEIECLEREGEAPVRVKGKNLDGKGVKVDVSKSSQFASALMMASLLWEEPFRVEMRKVGAVSVPYIEMTRRMCEEFSELKERSVYRIETDWSAASYFYEYGLLHRDVCIEMEGLLPAGESLQGDAVCGKIFEELGKCEEGARVELDMRETPDLVPALVVGMCRRGIRFRVANVGHLRHKESDRIGSLEEEMGKAGYVLGSDGETLWWEGEKKEETGGYASHGDHRIVMALAAGGYWPIENWEVVRKSFPGFLGELRDVERKENG